MAGSTGSGGSGLPGGNSPASVAPVKAGPAAPKPPPVNNGGVPPKQAPAKPVMPAKQAAPKAPKAPAGPSTNKNYNWMASLSPAQVQSQALNTIKAAYAPVSQSLDQQETRAQAVASKQAADNQVYRQWLDTMMSQLQAHQDMSNQAVLNEQNQIQAQQKGLYSGTPGTGGYAPGNPDDLHQLQARNQGLIGAAETQAASNIGTGSNMVAATRVNNYGLIAAGNTKNQSALDTALANIANQRTKLITSEHADVAKEIARLQGVEINKVSSNRNFAAAISKLGIQQGTLDQRIKNDAQIAADKALGRGVTMRGQDLTAMNNDRNYQLHKDEFGQKVAQDQYQRDHGLGPYKPSATGQKKPLSVVSQNAMFSKIDALRGQLTQLHNHGVSVADAWHLLHNGGPYTAPDGQKFNIKAAGNDQFLNAAYNVNFNGGLSQGDYSSLQGLGLNIGNRYPQQHSSVGTSITNTGSGSGAF